MGITGLWAALEPAQLTLPIRALALETKPSASRSRHAMRVGIDAPNYLHKFLRAFALDVALGRYTRYAAAVVSHLRALRRLTGWHVTLVFDGESPPMKAEVNERRGADRCRWRTVAAELVRLGDLDAAKAALKHAPFHRGADDALQRALRRDCQGEELVVVTAPFEADAQLAFMARQGRLDAIVTEDSDVLLYQPQAWVITRVSLRDGTVTALPPLSDPRCSSSMAPPLWSCLAQADLAAILYSACGGDFAPHHGTRSRRPPTVVSVARDVLAASASVGEAGRVTSVIAAYCHGRRHRDNTSGVAAMSNAVYAALFHWVIDVSTGRWHNNVRLDTTRAPYLPDIVGVLPTLREQRRRCLGVTWRQGVRCPLADYDGGFDALDCGVAADEGDTSVFRRSVMRVIALRGVEEGSGAFKPASSR